MWRVSRPRSSPGVPLPLVRKVTNVFGVSRGWSSTHLARPPLMLSWVLFMNMSSVDPAGAVSRKSMKSYPPAGVWTRTKPPPPRLLGCQFPNMRVSGSRASKLTRCDTSLIQCQVSSPNSQVSRRCFLYSPIVPMHSTVPTI